MTALLVTVTLWGHAMAALLFAALLLAQVRRAGDALPRLVFAIALGASALWALAVAGLGPGDISARIGESVRTLAWLGFMAALVRRDRAAMRATMPLYGVTALLIALGGGLAVIDVRDVPGGLVSPVLELRIVFGMMVALATLVLLLHLLRATSAGTRGGIALVLVALMAMATSDLLLYGIAYAQGGFSPVPIAARGIVMVLVVPMLAIAAGRNGDWEIQVSRTIAYQSLSIVAVLVYVFAMALATSAVGALHPANPRIVQTAFVFGTTAALMTMLSTPWLRAWTRVKLAKHLFRHRYDYRGEWLRFADTLGTHGDDDPGLEPRLVKAIADVTDSPGGLLLACEDNGVAIVGAWNWRGAIASGAEDAVFARLIATDPRIIELDALCARGGTPTAETAIPGWICESPEAWAIVPLFHYDRGVGAVLLARPPVDRALDWEDFDLLRVAGRQVASYLAEARAQRALADARRFDEFNRRFAFILHDIKNLISQLSLTARNAERHADNPEFRADMIETLKSSADRMTALLTRLGEHRGGARCEPLVRCEVLALAERIARGRRTQHPIVCEGDAGIVVMADPARLEKVLDHLVQNAIEASATDSPVLIVAYAVAGRVAIDVVDRGTGMSAAFVRDELFKPFVSSKPSGFGIGAFEARQLAEAMGGAIEVTSREGEGTCFRVLLNAARDQNWEEAA